MSTTTPHSQTIRSAADRRTRFRTLVLLLPLLLVIGAPLSPPAVGALAGPVGPTHPQTGFPAYYTDTHGLSLHPCLDGPPLCPTTAADLLGNGADGEGFYSAVSTTAGGIDLGLDLEMAYFGPGAGQEIVFARTQYSANGGGLVPDGVYTVTDPYGGPTTCTADVTGAIKTNGCRTDQGGGPLDFTTALGGRVGPFLTWDTLGAPAGGPPPGYIGDGVTEHRVTGSPTGFNAFRVQGPGIASTCPNGGSGIPGCAQTDLFVVSGKLAPGPAAVVGPAAIDFGNLTAPATRAVTVTSLGTENLVVLGVSTTGPFAAKSTCATVAPGSGCTINITFTPVSGRFSSGVLQIVDNTRGSPRTVALAGRSVAAAVLDPASLFFGTRKVGAGPSQSQKVTVRNVGVSTLEVVSATPSSRAYDVNRSGCSAVKPGDECALRVSFDPSAPGSQPATVDLVTNGGSAALPVTGEGVGLGRPRVVARTPAAGARIASRRADIGVRFNERMRGVDTSTFKLTDLATGRGVRAEVERLSRHHFVLDPRRALAAHHRFRVRLRGGADGITDRDGIELETRTWKFRTR